MVHVALTVLDSVYRGVQHSTLPVGIVVRPSGIKTHRLAPGLRTDSRHHCRSSLTLQSQRRTWPLPGMLIRYLRNLSNGRLILWCYLIWYSLVLARYFDASVRLWLTSVGLSLIIGLALYLSTTATGSAKVELDFWKTFRLFLMPFCVSSFAALVKGKGFILVFSPHPLENLFGLGLCGLFCVAVFLIRRAPSKRETSQLNTLPQEER